MPSFQLTRQCLHLAAQGALLDGNRAPLLCLVADQVNLACNTRVLQMAALPPMLPPKANDKKKGLNRLV